MASPGERYFTINLEEIINDYTWKRFLKSKSVIKRPFISMKKDNYYIDIRWGYAEFKHETIYFKVREEGLLATKSTTEGSPKKAGGLPSVDADGNRNVVLYYSEYENLTPVAQQYTFSTTRETTASTSVEFQETYTKGGSANIEISVPGDIVTIGAGLSGELSVTDTNGQSYEEKMTWQVNTDINVKEGHKAQATVYVAERNSLADFEVKSIMHLPDGKDMPVAVRRKSDDKIVFLDIIADLKPVFDKVVLKNHQTMKLVEAPDEERTMMRYNLELISHGTCKSISWKNQHVHVDSFEIKKFDNNGTQDQNSNSKTQHQNGSNQPQEDDSNGAQDQH